MTAQTISLISFGIISIIVLLFAFIVLWKIWKDEISLKGLLTEIPAQGGPQLATRRQACRAFRC